MKSMLSFYKMSGSGNDFILIDNRDGIVEEQGIKEFVVSVCRRRFSVGADGLILIERSANADFRWQFFNQDGSLAEMCGNGGRCAARFAYVTGICGKSLSFETDAGVVCAVVDGIRVRLEMTSPKGIVLGEQLAAAGKAFTVDSVNTGVPHAIIWLDTIDDLPVVEWGRAIRFHERFAPKGMNVNFVCKSSKGGLCIRTYERGVEDETMACGTGSVAAAIIASERGTTASPLNILTRGGMCLLSILNGRDLIIKMSTWKGTPGLYIKGSFFQRLSINVIKGTDVWRLAQG
ncbi:MAG: diaminopimelate epimerase [Pseudomonadota bacterium]